MLAWLIVINFHIATVTQRVAYKSGPPTARKRYAIDWRNAGGPLVARRCVLAGYSINRLETNFVCSTMILWEYCHREQITIIKIL